MENGQAIAIIRGAYKGGTGAIQSTDEDFPGFYWVWMDVWNRSWRGDKLIQTPAEPKRIMLGAGQMEKR